MLTGENGILGKATTAKAKSAEEEARERVNLILADWKMENTINGISLNDFLTTDEYKTNRESQNVSNVEVENENYIITVEGGKTKYEVTINAEDCNSPYIYDVCKAGNRLSVITNINGYKFVGDEEGLQITISATAPEGHMISSIESEDSLTNVSISSLNKQSVSAVYKVLNNSEEGYKFIVILENGDRKEKIVKVNNFLSSPELPSDAITGNIDSISIDLNKITKYPSKARIKYKYCYSTISGSGYTETTDNPIKSLSAGTVYYLKLKAYFEEDESKCLYSTQEQSYELKFGEYISIENIKNIEYSISGYGDSGALFDRDLDTMYSFHHDLGESTIIINFNDPQKISNVSCLFWAYLRGMGCNVKLYGYTDNEMKNEINIGEKYSGIPQGENTRVTIPSSDDLFYTIKIVILPDMNWQYCKEIEIFK